MKSHTSTTILAVLAIVVCGGTAMRSSLLAEQAPERARSTAVPAARESTSRMTDVERLLAIEAIKQLKARYYRCMDTKDWACLEAVFAPDAQARFLGSRGEDPQSVQPVVGRAKVAAYIRQAVETLVTVHHGHMPEIEITSPTTGRGIWAMEDRLQSPDGKNLLTGYGHYHETYERIDGAWTIKTLLLTRLRVDRAQP